jgi:hypothetical protein
LYVYGVVIALGPTGEHIGVRPAAKPQDAEASLRAELSDKLIAAQSDIESQLAELRRADPGHRRDDLLGQGTAKVLRLSGLREQLAGGAKDATALRADIASAIADIRAYASEVRGAASATQNAPPQQAALYQASEAARGSVNDFMRDYYDEHVFDRYLRFASVQDEEEYRRREDERHRAIEKALGKRTPEGNLRANELAIEQLKDAGTHGADRSPEYKSMLDNLETHKQELERRIAQQPAISGEDRSQKTSTISEAASALQAAGVSLANASDTPCLASTKCTTQVGRA